MIRVHVLTGLWKLWKYNANPFGTVNKGIPETSQLYRKGHCFGSQFWRFKSHIWWWRSSDWQSLWTDKDITWQELWSTHLCALCFSASADMQPCCPSWVPSLVLVTSQKPSLPLNTVWLNSQPPNNWKWGFNFKHFDEALNLWEIHKPQPATGHSAGSRLSPAKKLVPLQSPKFKPKKKGKTDIKEQGVNYISRK